MDRQTLKSIIVDQHAIDIPPSYYEREVFSKLEEFQKAKEVVILTGLRRGGKSTVLQVLRKKSPESDFYLNFDDDRLVTFLLDDFQMLYELWIELYGVQRTFYLDEIQNILGWERFVRRLHDKGMKVYVTGSNATLLSQELGTKLTGRHLTIEVFPFSFKEMVRHQNPTLLDPDSHTTEQRGMALHLFSQYCDKGGIPEYVLTNIKDILSLLYEGILFRDIVARYKLQQQKALQEMVYYLASNLGKPTSYNALRKSTNIKSVTTISEYCHYLEQAYLCFFLTAYSHSLKEQAQSPKKVYFIDHILAKTVGFQIGLNRGRSLENIVCIELKRRGHTLYYHKGKKECDFIIKNGPRIEGAIQVCAEWHEEKTRDRELAGLQEAMEQYHLDEGWILTEDRDETIPYEKKDNSRGSFVEVAVIILST